VHDEHPIRVRIDLDPVPVHVVVDDVVRDELVDAFEVDAMALVSRARAVVVDRVPEDLEVMGRGVAVNALVGRVADLVARELDVVRVILEEDVGARGPDRALDDESVPRTYAAASIVSG